MEVTKLQEGKAVNSDQILYAIRLLSIVAGSSVLVTFIKNRQINARAHQKLVSEASKSALKRAEMYYIIRRRTKSNEDVVAIRNAFHTIQEENNYYKTLLMSESKWHGERYGLYVAAIQRVTGDKIRKAWKQKAGPDVEVKLGDRPDSQEIDRLANQFSKDCRRLINPLMRVWMRLRDSWLGKKVGEIKVYDAG